MGTLKNQVKAVVDKTLTARYHYTLNTRAKKALSAIEQYRGKLNPAHKRNATAYAQEVFGWKGYAPWLYVYTLLQGEFKEGWIPENYYGKIVVPKIAGDYGRTSFLKPLANRLFGTQVTLDLGYRVNGSWYTKDYKATTLAHIIADAKAYCSEHYVAQLIFKKDTSMQGKGIVIFNVETLNVSDLETLENGVLQPFIKQHPIFNEFTATAVATIRLTTVIDKKGNPSLRASFIRLGREQHTHVQSNNQLLVPLDLASGSFEAVGYDQGFKKYKKHPDAHVAFKGKQVPNYKALVTKVLQLHAQLPQVKVIGWDATINHSETPVVIEWNGYGAGIAFSEATQGPGFSDLNWSKFIS